MTDFMKDHWEFTKCEYEAWPESGLNIQTEDPNSRHFSSEPSPFKF